ncbi:hypothetical protein KQH41_01090 [bacterium]|nr:hypothetical protein [bacterium]
MLAKDVLRKTDLVSGACVAGLGLFIISQAWQMPMKDSYGGVQNVWYVSPALFPLFVGAMLTLLGVSLVINGVRLIGREGVTAILETITGGRLLSFLSEEATIRFYTVVFNLLMFVFLLIPRVDFFAASLLFLLMLFTTFYCGDRCRVRSGLRFSVLSALAFTLLFVSGLSGGGGAAIEYPCDWLALGLAAMLAAGSYRSIGGGTGRNRFWISVAVAVMAPLSIGVIFKYFLMVPLPTEGLIVELLDIIRYAGR